MPAGSEGIGDLDVDDDHAAFLIGTAALMAILFDGLNLLFGAAENV